VEQPGPAWNQVHGIVQLGISEFDMMGSWSLCAVHSNIHQPSEWQRAVADGRCLQVH